MAEQAHVTSLEALEAFRASLIVFLGHAHRSVDEVGDEVRRTRGRLQNDWRTHWEQEIRKRRRLLDQAEQELLSAKLSNLRDNISAQQNAVRKAKEALEHAEKKLRAVKKWLRDFDGDADPLVKRIGSLRHVVDFDLPKGVAFLLQAQKTLEGYTETGAARPTTPTAAPATTEESPQS
jgi:DNA repair exonuclease SbcCD ATPase subunit